MGAKTSVFLYSSLAFCLQLILLKIFEYLLLFTSVAEALPIGLLGMSVGTITAAIALKKYSERDLEKRALAILVAAMVLVIPATLFVAHFLLVTLSIFCLATLGFLVAIHLIGRRFSASYLFEILGSVCGVLLVWALLPRLGAELLFLGCILAVALMAAWKKVWPALGIALTLLAPLSLAASFGFSINLIRRLDQTTNFLVPNGGRVALRDIPKAELMATKWSMLDRVDAIRLEDSISLFFNDRPWSAYYPKDSPVFPYPPDAKSALIIGVGAGKDIRDLKAAGTARIVGAEISHHVVDLMSRGPLYELSERIYDSAEVHAINGRAFLRQSREEFDILLSQYPDLMAGGKISQALGENYLWTVESFGEFFRHLSPGGQFFFSRTIRSERPASIRTFRRYLATLAEGMRMAGITAKNHGQVFLTNPQEGVYKFHFVVKKSPFTKEEVQRLDLFFAKAISVVKPHSTPPLPPVALSKGVTSSFLLVQQFFEGHRENWPQNGELANPATDDRPFLEYVREHALFSSYLMNLMLGMILAFIAALIFFGNRFSSALRASLDTQLHCFFSGAYFCLIEIYLIRRLNFYFGIPVQNMAVVLLVMLLGAALPAAILATGKANRLRWLVALSPAAALLFFALDPALGAYASERWAYGAFVLLILPIGIFSSFLFPYFGRQFPESTGLLYGLNLLGFFFGAALALALGLELGNRAVFFTAFAITATQSLIFILSRSPSVSSLLTRQDLLK